MDKKIQKAIAIFLSISAVLSFAGCGKKTGKDNGAVRSGDKISADSPWFDSKEIKIDLDTDTGNRQLDYKSDSVSGADEKWIVVYTSGSYKVPDQIDGDNYNAKDYSLAYLTIIDRSTYRTEKTIDLVKEFTDSDYIDSITYKNGKLTVKTVKYDATTYESIITENYIDPESGKVTESKECPSEAGKGYERTFDVDGYTVSSACFWDENDNEYYELTISSPDGNTVKTDTKGIGKAVYDVPVILSIGNNRAVVPFSTDDGYLYYELNLADGSLTAANDKEYEWLGINNLNPVYTDKDGTVYSITTFGITKINVKNRSVDEFFNYDWCDVNRNRMLYLNPCYISDDTILLCGDISSDRAFAENNSSEFTIYEMKKAGKNPHAGKTVLELYASYGGVDNKIGDSIVKFNETNGSYYIVVTDRYSDDNQYADYSNVNSIDEYETADLNFNSKKSNAFAIDIMNGDGPDMMLNCSAYGQLNNLNYLVDLSEYIGSLDPDKYYTNIIDISKVDGKLYHLPLTFAIDGIQTDTKYAGRSGRGFTTDEYKEFVRTTLNGKDLITSGQVMYFTKLFSNMSDKFIVNGKADFSGEDFAKLAEYVKENVPDKCLTYDELYAGDEFTDVTVATVSGAVGATIFKGDRPITESANAIYYTCCGFSDYFTNMPQNGTAILGLPSSDGRGPMIQPQTSIAVSAQAQNVDACCEFVKMLLADDVQDSLAQTTGAIVLNRDAFRSFGKAAVKYYNGEGQSYLNLNTSDNPNARKYTFSDKNIDDLEKVIMNCSRIKSEDSAISLVLAEEMPAYFSGQKDLNSVISIAQDRCQKILNERG